MTSNPSIIDSHPHPKVDADESSTPSDQSENPTSSTEMRQLVLNYLIHNCYLDTAIAFSNDGVSLNQAALQDLRSTTTTTTTTTTATTATTTTKQNEMEVDSLLSIDHKGKEKEKEKEGQAGTSKIGELSSREIQSVRYRKGESFIDWMID